MPNDLSSIVEKAVELLERDPTHRQELAGVLRRATVEAGGTINAQGEENTPSSPLAVVRVRLHSDDEEYKTQGTRHELSEILGLVVGGEADYFIELE